MVDGCDEILAGIPVGRCLGIYVSFIFSRGPCNVLTLRGLKNESEQWFALLEQRFKIKLNNASNLKTKSKVVVVTGNQIVVIPFRAEVMGTSHCTHRNQRWFPLETSSRW